MSTSSVIAILISHTKILIASVPVVEVISMRKDWFFFLSWNFDCSKMPTTCWSFSQFSVFPTQKPQKPLIWSPLSSSQSWSTNLFRMFRFENVRFWHLFNFYGSPNFPKLLVISYIPNVICVSISPTLYSRFVPLNHESKVLHLRRRISQKVFGFFPCLDIRRVSGFHNVLLLLSQLEIETIHLHS